MDNTSVIIASCDKFSDTWQPFLELFDRHWPSCPWPVYFITNEIPISHPRIKNIMTGRDREWCPNLLYALDIIESDKLLLFLDDCPLIENVNNDFLFRVDEWSRTHDEVGCIRVSHKSFPLLLPRPYREWTELGRIDKGTPYRISTAPAMWRREFLEPILKYRPTAWGFELEGTSWADENMSHEVLSTSGYNDPIHVYWSGVCGGEWSRNFLNWAEANGIEIDTSKRKIREGA